MYALVTRVLRNDLLCTNIKSIYFMLAIIPIQSGYLLLCVRFVYFT